MADSTSSIEPAIPQPRERSGSTSLGNNTTTAPPESGAHPSGAAAPSTATPSNPSPAVHPASRDVSQEVKDVLASDIGVSTMLNRLKQSIASAKEFAMFLKKRSQLEEEHATGLKKLCHVSQDNMRRTEHRHDSFAAAYQDVMIIHDRMSENALQFAASLHHMQEDLIEMAAIAEKSRKGWKQNGLAAEQRVHDIEQAMRKSKAKYDALADEYERVKTGDARPGGRGIFKAAKSAAQQEEDLLRKVQAADQDYRQKVQTLQNERAALTASTRPEAVQALRDLVRECDAGLALQLQKFASFNEKLLLSNGLTISPIKPPGSENPPAQRSLRDIAGSVDNEKDFTEYILSFHNKLPQQMGEPKYERHPVLSLAQGTQPTYASQPQGQHPVQQPSSMGQPMSQPAPSSAAIQTQRPGAAPGMRMVSGSAPPQPPGTSMAPTSMVSPPAGPTPISQSFGTLGGGAPTKSNPPTMSGAQPWLPSQQQHERSYSQGNLIGHNKAPQQQYPTRNSAGPVPRFNGTSSSQSPPQLGSLPFQLQGPPQGAPAPASQGLDLTLGQPRGPSPPQPGTNPLQQHPPTNQMAPPSRPVFGISLEKLYERDQNPVPLVVYKCIQAIDLFGLNNEGIYRLSGSQTHVQRLRTLFDTAGPNENAPNTDFRNPENFFHDVNSVAGLLKQFFRDLPDPLLTRQAYDNFIEAAKNDDDIVRRDSLHAIINGLPDPNYATLKALTLHLHRVMNNSAQNRMGSQNLAIVFGPTLLGGKDGNQGVENAAWQSRVIDTILQNTYQIFDED